jgi:hypothetical protein
VSKEEEKEAEKTEVAEGEEENKNTKVYNLY